MKLIDHMLQRISTRRLTRSVVPALVVHGSEILVRSRVSELGARTSALRQLRLPGWNHNSKPQPSPLSPTFSLYELRKLLRPSFYSKSLRCTQICNDGNRHARRRFAHGLHLDRGRSSPCADGIHIDMNHLKKGEVKYGTHSLIV